MDTQPLWKAIDTGTDNLVPYGGTKRGPIPGG
jgi:hypothetical protein